MAETKTAETKRMKLEILEVKEKQPIGDRGAVKLGFKAKIEDKELWFFTFSGRLFEAIETSKGQTIEADVVISAREYDGNTYIDRKVTQIYKDGRPIATTGGRQYGKSPEELEQTALTMCLAYAKDLAIADKIKVEDILNKADEFHKWVQDHKMAKAIAPKAEVKAPAPKASTPQVTKKPEPKVADKGKAAEKAPATVKAPTAVEEDLFGEGESKGKVPKTQKQLFNYVAKHAGHKDTKFTKAYIVNKFKIPETRIDENIVATYHEIKALKDWPEYDGE